MKTYGHGEHVSNQVWMETGSNKLHSHTPPPPLSPGLKSMAGLVEISLRQVHETGAEIGSGFADSRAGFQKFGAELQSLGQTVDTLGQCPGQKGIVRQVHSPVSPNSGFRIWCNILKN